MLPFKKKYVYLPVHWDKSFSKKIKTKQQPGSPRRHVLSYLLWLNSIPELHTSLLILSKMLHEQQMLRNWATLAPVPTETREKRQAQFVSLWQTALEKEI